MTSRSEPRHCPACKSDRRKYIGDKNSFLIYSCTQCRTLYTGHVPASEEEQDYDQYYSESNLSVPAFVRERVGEIVKGFSLYRTTGNFLDIGFGAGTMLEIAKDSGWNAHGLEVSKPAVLHARSLGFEVFHGSLAEARYPNGYFDVIAASEILEHLADPAVELREAVRILRPGGLLWATTPSARALSFRLLKQDWSVLSPPEHIQLYSKHGAMKLLKDAGFAKVAFRTHGLNPSEIVAHYKNARRIEETTFDRVQTAYKLNESLTRSPLRKLVKTALNGSLDLFGLGDSLKIYAETK